MAEETSEESALPKSAKRALRTAFTKKEWDLLWKTVLGTLGFVAITAGPLVTWLIKIKDGQISTLQSEKVTLSSNSSTGITETLKAVQADLAKFRLAFPMSTFDGTVALGNSSKPTPITQLMSEAQDLINARKFDAAEEKLKAVDALYPNFPGANFFRFTILQSKGEGYKAEAEVIAEKVISTMTDATDYLKPLYEFAINQKLNRGEKAAAEKLMRTMLVAFPADTNLVTQFSRVFGYTPSATK